MELPNMLKNELEKKRLDIENTLDLASKIRGLSDSEHRKHDQEYTPEEWEDIVHMATRIVSGGDVSLKT
jgi:hypothetical protein